MIFQKKDMDTWDRAEIFCHFIDELRCVMSMTVELDVTAFVNALKKRGCSFYPSMLWVVSAAVNQREELRMGYNARRAFCETGYSLQPVLRDVLPAVLRG